jgi:hypothetical protein
MTGLLIIICVTVLVIVLPPGVVYLIMKAGTYGYYVGKYRAKKDCQLFQNNKETNHEQT